VHVVTRTKDRPLLLKRACETILAQTCGNWNLVLVNDGGCAQEVEDVIAPYRPLFGERLAVIHNHACLGAQQAANIGLDAGDGEFAAFLDDDDTWRPDFLLESVAFLTAAGNERLGAVACHVKLVRERIENGAALFETEEDFNSWMRVVRFDRAMAENHIPSSSFVFRRAVLEAIGGHDEALPILGDWEFRLRLLSVADIGVVEKPLARWHQRTNLHGTPYENMHGTVFRQREEAALHNAALRWSLKSGTPSPAMFMSLNNSLSDLAGQVAVLGRGIAELPGNAARQVEECLERRLAPLEHIGETLRLVHEGLSRQGEGLAALARLVGDRQNREEQRFVKIDELHLWLGILTWPLRAVWRPIRRTALALAGRGGGRVA
jgi:glycosyltransferase involved in cell wall biosynthesis